MMKKMAKPTDAKSKQRQAKEEKTTPTPEPAQPSRRKSTRLVEVKAKPAPVYYTEAQFKRDELERQEQRAAAEKDGIVVNEKQREQELREEKASNYYQTYKPNCLHSLNFVITGALSVPRENAKIVIQRYGGYVQGKVDKTTSFVVMGERVGNNKTSKAKEFKIPAIREDQLFRLLRCGKFVTLTDPDSIPKKQFTPRPKVVQIKPPTNRGRPKKKVKMEFEEDQEFENNYTVIDQDEEAQNVVQASIMQGIGMELALEYMKPDQFI